MPDQPPTQELEALALELYNAKTGARVEIHRASGFYVERVKYAGEWEAWEYWSHGSSFTGQCDGPDHGKQLCQAEHERRLLEFLSPVEKASQP